jgi:hypothetical protein
MSKPSLRLAGALTLLTFTSGGCSWIFMSKAPEPVVAPNYPVECTSSRAAPVLDSIFAGLYVVNAIAYASVDSCDSASFDEVCFESSTKAAGIAVSAGLAAVLVASATSGFRSATRCGQVKGLNALCITGDLAACQALRPGFVPAGQPGADPWGTRPPDRWGPPQPAPAEPQQAPPPQGPPAGTQ